MAKMFFSLSFWMAVVLFIALTYALGSAIGADCSGSNCGDQQSALASSALHDQSRSLESNLGAGDFVSSDRCAPQTIQRRNDLSFQQFANLQAGEMTYAPGLSFSMTQYPERVTVCPGPIEIPAHY
ncbi:MAG: hypothetical protein ACREQH_02650 [Candidatus Binatus sp.]